MKTISEEDLKCCDCGEGFQEGDEIIECDECHAYVCQACAERHAVACWQCSLYTLRGDQLFDESEEHELYVKADEVTMPLRMLVWAATRVSA